MRLASLMIFQPCGLSVLAGRIDALGTICAFAVVSIGTFDAKVEFIFNVFDFNGNGSISEDELVRGGAAQCCNGHMDSFA